MTYKEAITKYPKLTKYNVSELELILTGMALADETAYEATMVIIEHMEASIKKLRTVRSRKKYRRSKEDQLQSALDKLDRLYA